MSTTRISRAIFAPSDSYMEPRYSRKRFAQHNNMNSSGFIISADDIGPRYMENIAKVIEMKQKQSQLLQLEKDVLRSQLRRHLGRVSNREEYGQSLSVLRNQSPNSESPKPRPFETPVRTTGRTPTLPTLTNSPCVRTQHHSQRFRGRPKTLRNPITGNMSWYE